MMHTATDCLKQVPIMKEVPKWSILTCFQMQMKYSVKHLVEIQESSEELKEGLTANDKMKLSLYWESLNTQSWSSVVGLS